LESIAALGPAWVGELRWLISEGPCEFIGSGYSQIIGPLVPADVNAANLRLGNRVYEKLLGSRPQVALVNEQTYSAGMVQHYLDAGYQAIVMEWNNPDRYHPEWNMEWRYLPQLARGPNGETIPVIWNDPISFQKFQRHAHGEIALQEYLDCFLSNLAEPAHTFPLHSNDIEIFDFRPGRYETETNIQEDGEWVQIGRLFEALISDDRFQVIRPSQALDLMQMPGAGNRLHLESPEQPIPVKKQGKYNITRWAVTGRDDLGINTVCWRIYEVLKGNTMASDEDWRELCYLWSSDFRTHLTEKRWGAYLERLTEFEEKGKTARDKPLPYDFLHQTGQPFAKKTRRVTPCGLPDINRNKIKDDGQCLTVETNTVKVRLNCRRGLAIDALWFKGVCDDPLCGTLPHGYYDDISL